MNEHWSILYRGPLTSCNYACGYCPFAKTRNTRAERREDEMRLRRFTDWVGGRAEEIGVLFTPSGEALIHRGYQRALCQLSCLPNIRRVAIQTNLSCGLGWLSGANPLKLTGAVTPPMVTLGFAVVVCPAPAAPSAGGEPTAPSPVQ